uniref:DDE_3 domain-containing protein n=1 Tax=Heterorhabditis bacteriophora TaxID=37862 RepID=A0A1I7WXV7_HETBA
MSKGKNITPNQRTKVVFSDESKFNRFGSDGKKYVRSRPGEEFMPKCTIPTIKHGGGSVMVCAAFNRNGPGPLHIVEGIMDSTSYVRILEDNLIPYVRSQRLGRNRIFLQDNNPKHSSNWPSQSPALNPIVLRQKPSNIKELQAVIKKSNGVLSLYTLCLDVVLQLSRSWGILRSISYVLTYCYCYS